MTIAAAQLPPVRRSVDSLASPDSPTFTTPSSPSPSTSTSLPPIIAIHPTLVAPVEPKTRIKLLKQQQEMAAKDPIAAETMGARGGDTAGGAVVNRKPTEEDFGYRRTWGMKMKDHWKKMKGGKPDAGDDSD